MTARGDSPADARAPSIAVVLCTWRGRRHLVEQLDSLAAQRPRVSVHVHDDASGDGTAELARRHAAVDEVVAHPDNVGYEANFERGMAKALADGHDYIALSDQDDVWAPDRIARTLAAMRESERRHGPGHPVLVHSDLSVVDADGASLHPSYLARRGYQLGDRPALGLVLGQNGVMGNTVLVNRALAERALPFPRELHVHDWWLALVAELHGERRFVDAPLVAYRTHADNASNPAGSIAPGALSTLRRLTFARLLARDFRLPFLEDSRRPVLERLLAGDGHRPVPEGETRHVIEDFVHYLRLEGSPLALHALARRRGFLRPGFAHRLRVLLALHTTGRYERHPMRTATSPSARQDIPSPRR